VSLDRCPTESGRTDRRRRSPLRRVRLGVRRIGVEGVARAHRAAL